MENPARIVGIKSTLEPCCLCISSVHTNRPQKGRLGVGGSGADGCVGGVLGEQVMFMRLESED